MQYISAALLSRKERESSSSYNAHFLSSPLPYADREESSSLGAIETSVFLGLSSRSLISTGSLERRTPAPARREKNLLLFFFAKVIARDAKKWRNKSRQRRWKENK